MARLLLSLVTLISWVACQDSSQSEGDPLHCSGPVLPLISGDRFMVEDLQFRASSSYSDGYLPHHARLTSASWCAQQDLDPHWLEVHFGANVIIHQIQIGGYDSTTFGDWYMESFEVQYREQVDGGLVSVVENGSSEPRVFTRMSGQDVETATLPSPIITKALRIKPIQWTEPEPCVRLEALGCLQIPGCESVEILSTNRTLLPLASIVATSAMSDDPASDVVSDSGITWCSAEEFSDGPAPYIMFSFTERVTLTHMRAHGGSGSQLAYVTRFSLDYKEIDGQSFNQYTLLTNEQAEFRTDNAKSQVYTFWRQPLQGQVFRFQIEDAARIPINNDFCWNVQLFGCLVPQEDITIPSFSWLPLTTTIMPSLTTSILSLTVTTTPTSISQPSSAMRATPTTLSPNIGDSAANAGSVIGGALGGVIFVILFALLVVVIVILLVIKRKKRDSPPASPSKEMYTTSTSIAPEVDDEENAYETIGSPLVYNYIMMDAPVDMSVLDSALVGTVQQDAGEKCSLNEANPNETSIDECSSLVDNIVYSAIPSAVNFQDISGLMADPTMEAGVQHLSNVVDNDLYEVMRSANSNIQDAQLEQADNPKYGSTEI